MPKHVGGKMLVKDVPERLQELETDIERLISAFEDETDGVLIVVSIDLEHHTDGGKVHASAKFEDEHTGGGR
jgi:hypothetical protein